MSSQNEAIAEPKPVIKCASVYKIFGENSNKMLQQSNGQVDAQVFQDAGCVVGVNNASFDVYEGEMLVVMGLSGSGKSTLLRCISRLTDTTAGDIFIDGQDLVAMNSKQLIELRRNKMGMVFQNFALLPHKTVLENIAFPLQVKGFGTDESVKRAFEMVELVGLNGRENYFPRQLSGGQQQRVGIARSLAVEPDIWFLDEPFSALDPLIRREMQDEFLRLQGMLDKTIVFITHDLDEALRIGDEISILRDGEVIQQGDPQSIIMKPADDYISDFIKDINRGRVLEVRSIMEKANRATGPKMGIKTPLEDALQQLVNAGKDNGAIVADDGKTIGKISMVNAIAAMARPDRGDEGPRYK